MPGSVGSDVVQSQRNAFAMPKSSRERRHGRVLPIARGIQWATQSQPWLRWEST